MRIEFTLQRFLVQGNFASVITSILLITFLITNVSFTRKVALSTTKYTVACGAAEYTPGDDVEKVIAASDRLMYENKRQIKGN
ncbi:MAG: hypothetical protein KBT02_12370 [Treponema sp.]|nr:hypothetical protein [Candidatus Treponema caballi]